MIHSFMHLLMIMNLVINYCCHFMFLNKNSSYLLLDNNNEHDLSSLSFVVIGKKKTQALNDDYKFVACHHCLK
jgi:hypothetical protein